VRGLETNVRMFPVPTQPVSLEELDSDHSPMSLTRRAFLVLATAAALSGCSTAMAPPGATSPAQLSQATIMQKINGTRAEYGRKPLTYNPKLDRAAKTMANLMASRNTISHTLGGTLRERVTVAGYEGAVGENLGAGQTTLESVIQGWLNSRGHRSTLLSPNFTEFGLAGARSSSGKTYWAFIAGGDFSAWY
jgi:uncharacterized protein YkwD